MTPVVAKINGKKCHFKSRHELARCLMDLLNTSQAPLVTRAENLVKIMELTGFDRRAKYLDKLTTEARYTLAWWDTLLALEHKGPLPGFSVTGDAKNGNSNYNPERHRVTTDWTL